MTIKVERHPGPFLGPDAELARDCATVTIPDYGDESGEDFERIKRGGIWNDHVAVQTALTVIHSLRKAGLLGVAPASPAAEPSALEIEGLARALEVQLHSHSPLVLTSVTAREIVAALRSARPAPLIDPTNHHNALKCPYCNPEGLMLARPADTGEPVAWRWKWPRDTKWSSGTEQPKFASDAAVIVDPLYAAAHPAPTREATMEMVCAFCNSHPRRFEPYSIGDIEAAITAALKAVS